MHVDASRYNSPRFIYPALCVTTLLLVSVFLMPGSHNTHRWIRFGHFFTFQPSEIAKPVLVLFLAWFLHNRLDAMRDWRHTLFPAAVVPVVFMLLVVARSPTWARLWCWRGVTAMMLVLAGMEWKIPGRRFCRRLPPLAALLFLVPWRRARMLVFLNPEADPQGAGYHITSRSSPSAPAGSPAAATWKACRSCFICPKPRPTSSSPTSPRSWASSAPC